MEAEKLLLVGMGISKPLPNPLLKGEGKGITFNTGEVYQRGFIYTLKAFQTSSKIYSASPKYSTIPLRYIYLLATKFLNLLITIV
jgi:hypothetical protein